MYSPTVPAVGLSGLVSYDWVWACKQKMSSKQCMCEKTED